MLGQGADEPVEQDVLLARPGRAADDDRAAGGMEPVEVGACGGRGFRRGWGQVVLGGTGDAKAVGRGAQVGQTFGIARRLHGEGAHEGQEAAGDEAELAVAGVGMARDAAVDHVDGHAGGGRVADEVRPHLVFHQDEGGGTEAGQHAADHEGQVDGEVEHDVGGADLLDGDGVGRGGVGGEDETEVRVAAAGGVHVGEGDGEFADAHGLDPDRTARGIEQGGDLGAVAAEALGEVRRVAAALAHAEEEFRHQAREHEREQRVVEQPDGRKAGRMDDERGVLHGVREDSVESGPGQAVCGGGGRLATCDGRGGLGPLGTLGFLGSLEPLGQRGRRGGEGKRELQNGAGRGLICAPWPRRK